MPRPRVRKGQLLALATAFCYALQNLAMRAAGATVDSFVVALFAALPTVLTSIVLTLADPSRRAKLAALWREGPSGRRLLGGLALAGLLGYAVGNPLFVKSLALGGAVIGTPSGNTVVIWSALLAVLFLGERLGRSAVAGIAIFIGGIVLLAWGQGRGTPVGPAWFWAVPLGAVAGLCWSAGSVGTRYALSRRMDAFAVLAVLGGPGLGGILAVAAGAGHLAAFAGLAAAGPEGHRVLVLMILAGLFNLGAQVTLTLAYSSETVARASIISSSSAVIVALLAWAFLGETLNPAMVAGILIVSAGVALVQGRTASGTGVGYLPNGRKNRSGL